MRPDQIDLARRLVACPRWRWVPGMGVRRWSGHGKVSAVARVSASFRETPWLSEGWLPDLTDPATAGCLLAMLVAADPGAGWGVSCGPDVGWRATSCAHDLSGATCGEALARALLVVWEAAP